MIKSIFENLFRIREKAGHYRTKSKPGADEGFDPYEKPFLDHLEDLRKTIAKIGAIVIIATIASFSFNKEIFSFSLLPLKLANLSGHVNFITLSPQEILILSIKVSFFAALIVSFPLLVYFLGEFILPGLKQAEKRYLIPGVGAGFLLFLVGSSFAFFLAVPLALKVFFEFQIERSPIIQAHSQDMSKTISAETLITGAKEKGTGAVAQGEDAANAPALPPLDPDFKKQVARAMQEIFVVPANSDLQLAFDPEKQQLIVSNKPIDMVSYRIGDYVSFVTQTSLMFGLAFQLPIVVTILAQLGLLTCAVMRDTRSYAWVAIFVISAVLTPGVDALSLLLMAGPLVLLYEICIWVAWVIEKGKKKAQQEEEEAYRKRMEYLYSRAPEDLSEEEKAEIHRREIEQYEKEHEHLYLEDSSHVAHDPNHDEGWHDDPYHDPYHDHPDHQIHGESDHDPEQSLSEGDVAGELESDHAEKTPGTDESVAEPVAKDPFFDSEVCTPSGPVLNLNMVGFDELMTLPGIDEELAHALLNHRPFGTFDEVAAVPGMTDEILNPLYERLMLD
ncbi:MAG: twin-arginine translocase subunit TatC [Verrucomicrobiales bacterium]